MEAIEQGVLMEAAGNVRSIHKTSYYSSGANSQNIHQCMASKDEHHHHIMYKQNIRPWMTKKRRR